MMTKAQQSATPRTPVDADQIRAILGNIDEEKIMAILHLQPTIAEVEEAAVWAAGDGDVLAKEGRPLSSTAAAIVDVLTADEEEEPPPAH